MTPKFNLLLNSGAVPSPFGLLHVPANVVPIEGRYIKGEIKCEHENMRQNTRIARFRSMPIKLTRGSVTVPKLGNVAFRIHQQRTIIGPSRTVFFLILCLPVHIFLFPLHLSVILHTFTIGRTTVTVIRYAPRMTARYNSSAVKNFRLELPKVLGTILVRRAASWAGCFISWTKRSSSAQLNYRTCSEG